MATDNKIRDAQARVLSIYEKRPDAAKSTLRAEAVIDAGLTCTVSEGAYQFILDMPEPIGGDGNGPTPGVHARASVSACVAIGIKLTATRLGIPLKQIKVDVEMDFDDAAMFGKGDATAAPLLTRIDIRIDSDASDEDLSSLINSALDADPYFLALRDPQKVETRIERI